MASHEVLEGLEYLGLIAGLLLAHGDLLTCSARHAELSDVLPALSLDLRASPRTARLPPSVQARHLLSRVASPERYVGLRVSRGELLLRRPLDCVLRGLWRSGSNGVFSCADHTTGPAMAARLRDGELLALVPDGPQRRPHQPGRSSRPRWTMVMASPSSSRASASTKPSPIPRSRIGEKFPLVRMPTCSAPRTAVSRPATAAARPPRTRAIAAPGRSPAPLRARPDP